MSQRLFEDKVGLVETVDKFVDAAGNVAKFVDEREIDRLPGARGEPAGRAR